MSEAYIIRGGREGRARLGVLSEAMVPFTGAFLNRAQIAEGGHVLDAGCGGGDVTRELARRVGPGGRVTGLDVDPIKIAMAREDTADIAHVEFIVADILTPDIKGPFDAVYTRFLLSHLTDPERALSRMLEPLKPGGSLLVEEVDFPGHFCQPPRASFDRYVAWYQQASRRRGADAALGARLPGLLRAVDVAALEVHAVTPCAFGGAIKEMAALTLQAIAASLVAEGIASQAEIDADVADLRVAAADDRVFMSMPRIVQCHAVKA